MSISSAQLRQQFSEILQDDDVEQKLATLAALLRQTDPIAFADEVSLLERFPAFFSALEHSLEKTTAEIHLVTEKFENLNTTTTALLDTLGEGLFSFGADGVCAPVFSKACLTLLGGSPAGRPLVEVLTSDADERQLIEALIKMLFDKASQVTSPDDILDLLPKNYRHEQGLAISLQYLPILNAASALDSVLVIATNHTEAAAAVQLSKEREQKVLTVLRIASNRNVFTQFYLTAMTYFSYLEQTLASSITMEQVKRDIHTLKGNGSIFNLQAFVTTLHELETDLYDVYNLEQAKPWIIATIPKIKDILFDIKMEAKNVLGDEFDQQGSMRTVPLQKLRGFAAELSRRSETASLAPQFIATFMGEPIQRRLASFGIGLQELADRYGKNINPCEYIGENFSILTENYEPLFNACVHIARNIVAHAIEEDTVRASLGKPDALTVIVDTQKFTKGDHEWFRISFTDDGGGIDVNVIRSKLRQTAAATMVDILSDFDVLQYIFHDNFSTKSDADELSGRGAGMSAIKARAVDCGGTAYVESELGIFTRTIIEVPLVWI